MKTKTIALLAAAMLTFGASNILAAESDNVVLNIKLHKIQSLVVNASQKAVNLEYNTVGDYANGVYGETHEPHAEAEATLGPVQVSADLGELTLKR